MALWTDHTRTSLIKEIQNCRVIWDRDLASDGNIKMLKQQAFQDIAHVMNSTFPSTPQYTCEDVRAQWKNLKDTYVRKQRYMNEGKYAYDNTKEPTWKFFRMLSFLDEKKDRSFLDISVLQREHGMDLVKNEHYENSNQSAASSEEQMLSLFSSFSQGDKTPAPPETPPSLPQVVSQSPSIQIIATKQGGTHSTVVSGDEDDEPRRKRPYHRRSNQTTPCRQDEFELFGSLAASQLRRMADEHSRSAALCLQKKINDMIFDYQMSLLNQNHGNHIPPSNHIHSHGAHNGHAGQNGH